MRNGDISNDAEESLNEWAEYFTELLNGTTTTSGGPPILPVSTDLDILSKISLNKSLPEHKHNANLANHLA